MTQFGQLFFQIITLKGVRVHHTLESSLFQATFMVPDYRLIILFSSLLISQFLLFMKVSIRANLRMNALWHIILKPLSVKWLATDLITRI